MTILDRMNDSEKKSDENVGEENPIAPTKSAEKASESKQEDDVASSSSQLLTQVESQFKNMLSEFQANAGFRVDTGEQAIDTMVEILSDKGVAISIAVLLSYIRFCVNHGVKKEIIVRIGYNKPAPLPMNFAINEELLEEIYPNETVEIN